MICLRQGSVLPRYLFNHVTSKVLKHNLKALNGLLDRDSPHLLLSKLQSTNPQTKIYSIENSADLNPPFLKPEYLPFVHPEVDSIKSRKELRVLIQKKGDNMETTLLVSILNKMMIYLHEEKWTNRQKLEIMESKEFDILLRTLHKKLSDINANEIVTIVGFLMRMEISRKSTLFQDIIKYIRENLDSVSFYKAAELHNYLQRRNIHKGAFKDALKNKLENHMSEKINELSPDDLINALYYAKYSDFSSKSMINVLHALLGLKKYWKDAGVIANYFTTLYKLPPEFNSEFTELKSKFFETLEELKGNKFYAAAFCNFLFLYGSMVYSNKAEYKPKLVDDLLDTVMEANIPLSEKIKCLKGLSSMYHVRYNFIDYVKDLILLDEKIFKEDYESLVAFLRALGDSNYNRVKPKEWLKVKSYIENLSNWKDEKYKWKELGLDSALSVAVDLASLGIYPDRFLQPLSQELNKNNELLKSSLGRLKISLLLNEALSTLEPRHSEHFRFLSKERVTIFKEKLRTTKTRGSEERDKALFKLKDILESAINQKNCVLVKRNTFQGVDIDITVAVNENGEPFNFSQIKDFKTRICIEDFNLPNKYKLVLVFIVPKTGYNRNVPLLRSQFTLKVKTLRAMGYRTLTVLQDEWSNVPDNEKGPYLWSLIKDKRNDLISNQSLRFFNKDMGLDDQIVSQYFELEESTENEVDSSEQEA